MTGKRDMLLSDASTQDIQLELIRRRRFNLFEGPKIVDSLLRHRGLWLAAYMDRWGTHQADKPDWLPFGSLIQLRDLRGDNWNVDLLFVLSTSTAHARQLYDIAEAEDWKADELIVQDNNEEVCMALGQSACGYGVLTAWWD